MATLTFSQVIEPGRVSVMFTAKPPDHIRAMLKANGFRWSPQGGFWWRRKVVGIADFLAALERRLNPGKPDGACWKCRSPNGFFRPQGAATPVYCDGCWRAVQAADPEDHTPYVHRTDRTDLDYEDQCARACGL
jgi:hypothetical protein